MSVVLPTPAEYARMGWPHRRQVMRRLHDYQSALLGIDNTRPTRGRPRAATPPLDTERVRSDAERILAGIPADPPHLVAARRRELVNATRNWRKAPA